MVTAARVVANARRGRAGEGRIHAHPVQMKPLGPDLLVRAADADFLAGLFDDLSRERWRESLAAPSRRPDRGEDGVVELPPPIHGVFALAVAEVHCTVFGMPRLDPAAIESASLVVRRIGPNGTEEGWMSAGSRRRGWLAIADPKADPDPERRLGVRTGNPAVDGPRLKAQRLNQLTEQEHPMFVAPPSVGTAAGRTIVIGVVPTASGETSETPVAPADFVGMAGDLETHFGFFLAASPSARALPFAGEVLHPDMVSGPNGRPREAFVAFLRLLRGECEAFGPSPEASALRLLLRRISLNVASDAIAAPSPMPADAFLEVAADRLLGNGANADGLRMPAVWPPLDADAALALRQAVTRCIASRFAGLAPQRARFEDPGRRYVVRAFVRIRCEDGCPGRIVWCLSESEPFRILPWWAGGGKSAAIPLPDITDPAVRKLLKPGVSFQVPPALANFINQDHSETLGGQKPGKGGSLGIGWLCSLSVPIVTVCAFIVLAIVVALLDFVFRWLPLFRICLPFPKEERRP